MSKAGGRQKLLGGSSMTLKRERPKFSVCIPAYNREKYLAPLLDSIFSQNYRSFDVLICEDNSPDRLKISEIARVYEDRYPGRLTFYENENNLGYDGNIRNLISKASGEYCFFMGNDDIMCPDALKNVDSVLRMYPDVGLVLKSYSWFEVEPSNINQTIRYFSDAHFMKMGLDAISICYRRSGVVSGYIIHRDLANQAATDIFDGTLFYQMHLTAYVLARKPAVSTPEVLVLCRNGVPPDFGNSESERGMFTPGRHTPQAMVQMINGVISILNYHRTKGYIDDEVVKFVTRDYANYFYPYIRGQLDLPIGKFWSLYREFFKFGFYRFPMFHFYFIAAYILGERRFDNLTRLIRKAIGRSPQIGFRPDMD